jgi:hypothetical protein
MKRTAKTLFELTDVIGECLTGELHIIKTYDNDRFTTYRVYTNEGVNFVVGKVYGQNDNDDFYDFQPVWQSNNKLTVYTANQLLEQFQK